MGAAGLHLAKVMFRVEVESGRARAETCRMLASTESTVSEGRAGSTEVLRNSLVGRDACYNREEVAKFEQVDCESPI